MKSLIATTPRREHLVPDPVRVGIYALPVAGILTLVPWIFILRQPDAKTNPEGFARAVTSVGGLVGGYLYIAGFVFLLLGLFALYGYLTEARASGWAAAGLLGTTVVIALTFATIGSLALAAPVLADAFLGGDKSVTSGLVLMSGESARIMRSIEISADLSLIGSIAFAVAVWRSGSLSKWAGILLVPGIFASLSLSPIVGCAGGVVLVITGVWLARGVGRHRAKELSASSEGTVVGRVVNDA
jgi:hypothetical protein